MKVLLVNGSPHKEGSTFTALSEAAESLKKNGIETEIFHIGTDPVRGCTACRKCAELKKCVFNDDCCNEIAAKIAESDGVIIGTPVYYSGANGALCALLDRAFFSRGREFAYKAAAAVVCCRRGGNSSAFDRINKYFTISNMFVVGSQYWNIVHGNNPQEVRQDLEGLQTLRRLADNMAYLLRMRENSEDSVQPPVPEAPQRTNFIR